MMDAKSGAWILPLICLLISLLSLVEVDGEPVAMTLLNSGKARGAVCLDGSPAAYHFAPGTGSGANSWMLHMEGGGWCRNTQECVTRKGNFRGSSDHMGPLSFSGALGGVKKSNPDFYNWNRIKLRYCDGASFTGDVEEVDPKTNLHYRGARIFSAVVDELLAMGMNKAENAILSGCSAGGLAAILHCDSFRRLLPANARVKCFSDAGYFIDGKDISGNEAIKALYADVVKLHNSAKNLPAACTAQHPANLCFFPQYAVQTLKTPLFILNAAYDSWQVRNVLVPSSADPRKEWVACKEEIKKCTSAQMQTLQGFRSNFLKALPARNSSSVAQFILSCHAHCEAGGMDVWMAPGAPMIDNTMIGPAVGDWFFDRGTSNRIDCPYPCNPTCHNTGRLTDK